MFFIFNNALLFEPQSHLISLVGQPESAITLSAPAVRLLQEFIRNKGDELSREQLITRVWDEYGFTPSGNNLNKAVSELRKSFQMLGEHSSLIVTVPRLGFRFEAEVVCQLRETNTAPDAVPENVLIPEKSARKPRFSAWRIGGITTGIVGLSVTLYLFLRQDITVPVTLKPVEGQIAQCRIWLINDHGRPLVLSKLNSCAK